MCDYSYYHVPNNPRRHAIQTRQIPTTEQRQIFTALEEPRITMGSTGDIVQLQTKMSGNKRRLLKLKYGSFVQVWHNDV